MREAINENRTVQLAILGVLALVGGLFLLKGMGGGDSSSASTPAPATASLDPATGAPTAAPATDPTTGAPVTDPATGAAVPASSTTATGSAVPTNLIPGPGLPKSLIPAYKHGDAIVLLVRRAGGTDDAFVHASVDRLTALPNVKVYVTKAKGIARYAWLTQGANVTDLPALVVLRPRKLTNGEAVATVSYGYRNANSVLQAVKDAVYRGPTDRPYYP